VVKQVVAAVPIVHGSHGILVSHVVELFAGFEDGDPLGDRLCVSGCSHGESAGNEQGYNGKDVDFHC
jgi:hypothetical protein